MRQPCDFVHKWNVNPLHTTAATLTVQTAITLCKYTMSFFGIFLASSKPLTAYLDLTILLIYETNISCILKEVYQNLSKQFSLSKVSFPSSVIYTCSVERPLLLKYKMTLGVVL